MVENLLTSITAGSGQPPGRPRRARPGYRSASLPTSAITASRRSLPESWSRRRVTASQITSLADNGGGRQGVPERRVGSAIATARRSGRSWFGDRTCRVLGHRPLRGSPSRTISAEVSAQVWRDDSAIASAVASDAFTGWLVEARSTPGLAASSGQPRPTARPRARPSRPRCEVAH